MMPAPHISLAFSTVPGPADGLRYRLSEDQLDGMPPAPSPYLTIHEFDRPADVGSVGSWVYSRIAGTASPGNDEEWRAPHLAVAFSAPAPGREDDYNRWYDEVHLAEALALPGHVGAYRYRRNEDRPAAMPSPYEYLAIYELDRPPAEPIAALAEALESGAIVLPDSVDASSLHSWMFSALAG